jgi:hypothetical protein
LLIELKSRIQLIVVWKKHISLPKRNTEWKWIDEKEIGS